MPSLHIFRQCPNIVDYLEAAAIMKDADWEPAILRSFKAFKAIRNWEPLVIEKQLRLFCHDILLSLAVGKGSINHPLLSQKAK